MNPSLDPYYQEILTRYGPPGKKIYYDTETVNFAGPVVLKQFAVDEGPIHLFNCWEESIGLNMALDYWMMQHIVVGFNLTFDAFMTQQWHNMMEWAVNIKGLPLYDYPDEHVWTLAHGQADARDGSCLRPMGAVDLMLVGRKGEFQKLLDRKAVYIRKVPTALVYKLQEELERRIVLDEILFARHKKKKEHHWEIEDIKDGVKVNPDFKTLVLKFAPAGGLKQVAEYFNLTGGAPPTMISLAGVPEQFWANEKEYAPFYRPKGGDGQWPDVVKHHTTHWYHNAVAQAYATDDIVYTRGVSHKYDDPVEDNDSTLAWSVGVTRWKGFPVDIEAIKGLVVEFDRKAKSSPKDGGAVLRLLKPLLSPMELSAITDDKGKVSTKDKVLAVVATWPGQAGVIARQVREARKADKRRDLFEKLIEAGRLHADFKIIGAKSGRMSGSGGLNAQAIPREEAVKKCFTLAGPGEQLSGGDFDAFEVAILAAAYKDENLIAELQSGTKIHTLFAEQMFPHLTRQEINKSKGKEPDYYAKGKQGVFAISYLAMAQKIADAAGITLQHAEESIGKFKTKFMKMAMAQKQYCEQFMAMSQKEIGSRIFWREPVKFAENFYGFKRFFHIEFMVMSALYHLSQNAPPEWKHLNLRVMRRDKMQSASGAVQSALYGAAFGIQGQVVRAANNHIIQSSGASVCKAVQVAVWSLQPVGIGPWQVRVMQVHDELLVSHKPELFDQISRTLNVSVESFRTTIPLIKMEWARMGTWADK